MGVVVVVGVVVGGGFHFARFRCLRSDSRAYLAQWYRVVQNANESLTGIIPLNGFYELYYRAPLKFSIFPPHTTPSTMAKSSEPTTAPPQSQEKEQKPRPIPNLPPPSSYADLSYEAEWKASSETIGKSIFGLAWYKDYLFGCTSSGAVVVWRVAKPSDDDDENNQYHDDYRNDKRHRSEDDTEGSVRTSRKPIVKFQAVAKGALYSIGIIQLPTAVMLGVCGEGGVLIYSWSDIDELITEASSPGKNSNKGNELEAMAHYKPHKSSHGIVEIKDFDFDRDDECLYAASGDAFGCYKWDTHKEELLYTYGSPKRGHLNTVKVLPSSRTAGGHSLLLLGGEDGCMAVWDRKKQKLIESIDIKKAMNKNPLLMGSTDAKNDNAFTPWKDSSNLWTSHIQSSPSSSSWWNVCGGASDGGTRGGYVTSWHAPTRSLASGCATRESPLRMAFREDSSSLATVANEGVVSYWKSPMQMERSGRFWCTPPCAHAIEVRNSDGWTAVAGVGNTIDLFENQGSKLYSLSM